MRDVTRIDWHGRVETAIERIHASLDDPVHFAQVASEVASSPYHFHRMFRALTGETFAHCVRRLRLERAAQQIERTERDITDVAFEAGFETPEAFSTAFKKEYGIRPSVVRKMRQWDGLLPSAAGIHYAPEGRPGWFFIGETGEEMQVKIVELPKQRLYSLRHVGDYWGLPAAWAEFGKKLEEQGFTGAPTTAMIVFHDHRDDVPTESKRSDPSVLADREIEPADGLFVQETPGGLYAVTPHFGSMEEIGLTWEKWRKEWLPESGWQHDTSRPSLEWYQNDYRLVPTELLLTLLCDPVKRE